MTALRSRSGVELVDGAVSLVRALSWPFALRAIASILPLAFVSLLLFEMDGVEHVGGLREVGTLALALAWWWRVHHAALLAAQAVNRWDPLFEAPTSLSIWTSFRSALVFGATLLPWGALFALLAFGGGPMMAFGLFLLPLRGGAAPSWLARLGLNGDRGVRTFLDAIADSSFRRVQGASAEALLVLALVLIGLNIWAFCAGILAVGNSMLGVNVAFAKSFASGSNAFFWGVIGLVAFVVLEPFRIALGAVHYVEARARLDGFDLRRMIERAVSLTARAVLACVVLWPLHASAQDKPGPEFENSPTDERALQLARSILSGDEYVEIERRQNSMAQWFADLWKAFAEWLWHTDEQTGGNLEHLDTSFQVPVWAYVVLIAVVVIAVGGWLYLRRVRPSASTSQSASTLSSDELAVAPQAHLDDAALWASRGDYRRALRTLYLATLVALERKGLLRLDPHRTNAQYLRALRARPEGRDFAEFTRQFDAHWYGEVPAGEPEYRFCRQIAERLCANAAAPTEAA